MTLGTGSPIFPIDGLVVLHDGGIRLAGSQCTRCGSAAFPALARCNNPTCDGRRDAVEQALLGPHGTVWSLTTIRIPVPAPFRRDGDAPHGAAMVDLPEGLRMIGLLDLSRPVGFGSTVTLDIEPLYTEDGTQVHTWIWRPASA